MSHSPQQPDDGQSRPMPPNYSQASGPQQPYANGGQTSGSQQNPPQYGSQQNSPGYGSQQQYGNQQPGRGSQQQYGNQQPGYGSQQNYGSQQQYGSPHPGYGSQQNYGNQQNYGSQQQYQGAQNHGMHGYGTANPAPFNSQALPEQAYGPGSAQFWNANESERTTVMWTHIGTLFIGFLPLIMFLVKKDESPFVREHTRQGLNAMITNVILTFGASVVLGIVGFILALVTLGLGMLIVYLAFIIPIVYAVLYIIAAVAANKGEGYRFPLTFGFVK